MRCAICGWIVGEEGCPCKASSARDAETRIPIGAHVLARAGRGPSMCGRWDPGEVQGYVGTIHRVDTRHGIYWCEPDDLLPESPRRSDLLVEGTRVWGLWLDGRWYPGTVDGIQGSLRHVAWDDGDLMWIEARNLAVMAVAAAAPEVGDHVLAPRWDGGREAAAIETEENGRFRVAFSDGEEAWMAAEELTASPPNPFLDPPTPARREARR